MISKFRLKIELYSDDPQEVDEPLTARNCYSVRYLEGVHDNSTSFRLADAMQQELTKVFGFHEPLLPS